MALLHMTDVNYADVKYSIVKKDGAAAWAKAAKVLEGLPIDFHSTTRALADTAADFKARFKLSLADAFAAALAKGRATLRGRGSPSGNGRTTLWFFAVRKGSRATMTGSSFLYRPKLAMRVETWKGVTYEETPILYAFRFAIGFDNDQCVCWPSGSCRTVGAPRLGARVCSLGPGRWARAEPNE